MSSIDKVRIIVAGDSGKLSNEHEIKMIYLETTAKFK